MPTVRYTYTADSKKLEGSRISREPFATSRGEAEQWIGRYPLGKAVEVYYDPKDPASSVPEFKTSVGAVIFGGLGSLAQSMRGEVASNKPPSSLSTRAEPMADEPR